ncbi:uncharacterized protein LOC110688707 isoform X1 [Chenopodium quinoa]|uniref:Uncharacterized protein n=1 Tax=Chenopodium quinoa TaxID=63459 RepID=A0A803MV05_CHEQI|nr:uncharacterized protein LOC110688707 isoform X1 [Chenopodium quinoa]XP_021721149.1 uncharacterized protein LOC110688707 isoform X1 [Chenopodium quinoa]XP_021721150.1 uncharacterized protein LOC110688707 isoform X1 [Chenopodium quinoa]XP_021721151.1 uncharacterized protein LOC110688707 isoform X1 [Chenopodium quinoa]XP_021721153.1 uncharacterized protein LOC110688707 isoform X1 [Chenopodium quinoa]XP_021721154.1 uncharacterized protein LOC110688707 isoform X1 [Chenopodium quinoa]XP_02172115
MYPSNLSASPIQQLSCNNSKVVVVLTRSLCFVEFQGGKRRRSRGRQSQRSSQALCSNAFGAPNLIISISLAKLLLLRVSLHILYALFLSRLGMKASLAFQNKASPNLFNNVDLFPSHFCQTSRIQQQKGLDNFSIFCRLSGSRRELTIVSMSSVATDAVKDVLAANYIPAAPILIPEGPWQQISGGGTAAKGFKAAGIYGGLRAQGEKPPYLQISEHFGYNMNAIIINSISSFIVSS